MEGERRGGGREEGWRERGERRGGGKEEGWRERGGVEGERRGGRREEGSREGEGGMEVVPGSSEDDLMEAKRRS